MTVVSSATVCAIFSQSSAAPPNEGSMTTVGSPAPHTAAAGRGAPPAPDPSPPGPVPPYRDQYSAACHAPPAPEQLPRIPEPFRHDDARPVQSQGTQKDDKVHSRITLTGPALR